MHFVAKELGMTVGELRQRMTFREFNDWMLFFKKQSEEAQASQAPADADVINLDAVSPEQAHKMSR